MGNYSSTKEEIRAYLYARIPLIILKTAERERAERMLRELAAESGHTMYYYTDGKQVVSFGGGSRDVDRDPMPFVQSLFTKNRGITFILGDVRRLDSENAFSRDVLDTLYTAMETSNTLVLVTPDSVWSRLAGLGLLTALDYPDVREREEQIARFVKNYGQRYAIRWQMEEVHQAAMLLSGFTEVQIDNVLMSTLASCGELDSTHVTGLAQGKSKLFPSVPCVEEVSIPADLKVAGLSRLQKWVRERRQLFFFPDEILSAYGLTAPKGMLLAGIPGCGKSYCARMTAKEWGLPLFRFDIGEIYDKWMGESEKKMSQALAFLDNMAPCVVWIDEIEKALAVSAFGNDTGKRVLGQFLFWLQESRKRVFLVATANDVRQLPPELFRKGRFSEIFFLDLPNLSERKETLCHYLARCLHIELPDKELEVLAGEMEGYSYSDIESVVKEEAQRLLLDPGYQLTMESMREHFRQTLPFAKSNPEAVAFLREWGGTRAAAASGTQESGGLSHE